MMTIAGKSSAAAFGCLPRDRGGNVIITFALATLPIVGVVGFAVDYSRANSVKAAMQAAIDSTALMLSKEAATDTSSQLQTNAQKYFIALFTRPEAHQRHDHRHLHRDRRLRRVWSSMAPPTCRPHSSASSAINEHHRERLIHRQVGLLAAARGAGARQHRIDGRRRQDRRAEDRDQEPADPIEECRQHQWRRLCLDHSVRQGRECRPAAITTTIAGTIGSDCGSMSAKRADTAPSTGMHA